MDKKKYALGAGCAIFCIDVITKVLTYLYIPLMDMFPYMYPYGGIAIAKNILGIEASLVYKMNTGAAWGLFADYQYYLLALRIVLVGTFIGYCFWGKMRDTWYLPAALVLSGAVGNIVDFFFYGHVVDMIHLVLWGYDYPVFNVADSAIFCGVVWLIMISSTKDKT
jgi:signal peptidase II